MLHPDPDDVVLHVGRRIAALRVRHGMTQDELAERAGVSLKYLQRIEAGRENLSIKSLARWAALLEAHVAELFRGRVRSQAGPGRPNAKRTRARRVAPR